MEVIQTSHAPIDPKRTQFSVFRIVPRPLWGEGKVKHREFVTEGLDSAPAAFMGLLKGANFGKQLVRVGPDKA